MNIQGITNKINSPIRKNILANLFGVGVNLCNQILLVPIFLHFWGTELYSDWIIISALSSFFMLSDVGINSVVQNRFAIKYSQNNTDECQELINCNLLIITIIFLIALSGAIIFTLCIDITKPLNLVLIQRSEASQIFLLLIVQVFVMMYMGVPTAILRAVQKNYQAVFIDQLSRLSCAIITLCCVIFKVKIVVMTALLCLPYIACLFAKIILAKSFFRVQINFKNISYKVFKNIFYLGLGFLSFPLANAILLQGFTLVVNHFFGANSVVLYNTTRTMCNFIKTFLNTILASVWPEYSIAYGNKDVLRMKSLYYKAMKMSVVLALIISALLLTFGPIIYRFWTDNEVVFSYSLMCAFLIVLIINTLWNTGCVALLSTNNHTKFGIVDVTATILSLICAIIVAKLTHSLPAIVYSTLIIDLILTGYVHKNFKLLIASVEHDKGY